MNTQNTIELEEFESVFKANYEPLCRYANSLLNDRDAAEETVQALFVKIWENRAELKIEHAIKSYLYSATRNSCYNQLRHLKIRESYKVYNETMRESAQITVEQEFEGEELNSQISQAIEKLPEGRRKVFMMSRFEGLKYKEIAQELNLSIKTVENQMGSAIKQLREDLAEYLVVILIMFTQIFS